MFNSQNMVKRIMEVNRVEQLEYGKAFKGTK